MVNTQLLEAMAKLTLPPESPNEDVSDGSYKDSSTAELEKLFLSPDQRFSDEWLNKLQQYSSSTTTTRPTNLLDAGISPSSMTLFSCWEQHYHVPEYDS